VIDVVEINADNQLLAHVVFDPDDIDTAFEELESRYLAGEAAPYSQTWSVVASSYAAFNRHEVPTADWVTIDHRRATPFEPSNMTPSIRTIWDLTPNLSIHIEAVHRLNDSGAVITHKGHGSSQEGFDAEWRAIDLLMVEGDRINRCEVFDEADIDAALARFEDLSRPAHRLENAASQVAERYQAHFVTRDWDAMAQLLAYDSSIEDRRRTVNSGITHGRDAEIEEWRAAAHVGFTDATAAVIATRGERIALTHARYSARDKRVEAFHAEALHVIEIDADERIAAAVSFDLDDIDAAFEELETRYIAGEAAAHARTWSLIVATHAAFIRRELPAMPPDLLDHRPLVTVEAGDPTANIRAMWEFTPDLRIYIEAVHRLSDLGAVFTQASHGTSQAGFEAEWRVVELVTVEGDRVKRGELFEEADLDAALARLRGTAPAHAAARKRRKPSSRALLEMLRDP
jgi:hypothetical protein